MIKNIAVGTDETTLYERSDIDDSEAMILTIYFCNYSGVTVNLTIYAKEVGNAAAGNGNIMLKDEPIEAGKTFEFDASAKLFIKGHTGASSRNKLSAKASVVSSITASLFVSEL